MDEELEPRERLGPGKALEDVSVEELRSYEDRLQRELDRVREVLKAKQDYLSGADSLFKI